MDKALIYGSKADVLDEQARLTKMPRDCSECINDKHIENCRKNCNILIRNKGVRKLPEETSTSI